MNSNFKFLTKEKKGYDTTLPLLNNVYPLTLNDEKKQVFLEILNHYDLMIRRKEIYFEEKVLHIFNTMYERCVTNTSSRFEFFLIELYLLQDVFEDVEPMYEDTPQQETFEDIWRGDEYENSIAFWTTLWEEIWELQTEHLISLYM